MSTETEALAIKWKLFIPWLKSKPPEQSYEYGDTRNCVLYQFVRETQGRSISAGGSTLMLWVFDEEMGKELPRGKAVSIPAEIREAVWASGGTIGGVLKALGEQG